MNYFPTNFDDDNDDSFFEEFNKSKDEDEKKLMRILEDLIEEMNDTKELQESMKRDYRRNKYVELTPDTQLLTNIHYLTQHSN